jgi:Flp pilus assembly protein TadG
MTAKTLWFLITFLKTLSALWSKMPKRKRGEKMIIKKILRREAIKGKKGVSLVLVALMIFTLVGIIALAIDVGHLMATRNELQNVADAAALAGAGYLGSEYLKLSPSDQQTKTFTKNEVAIVVGQVAGKNKASGKNISINENDIIIGRWDPNAKEINPETLTSPDAVYVKARRDENANSPISTFFARIFGIDTMNVSAKATAALSGPAWVEEGEMKLPVGISERWFPDNCGDTIFFSKTSESCAGWHNFFWKIDGNTLEEKLLGIIKGDACENCPSGLWDGSEWLTKNFGISPDAEVTPTVSAGDAFNFQGGTIAKVFNGSYLCNENKETCSQSYEGNGGEVKGSPQNAPAAIFALFDYFRFRDGDNNNNVWTATVPVYQDNPEGICINPNGKEPIPILGFARVMVTSINGPPDNDLSVIVDCKFTVIEGRGGGITFGNLKGSIPGLVK